jgi:predicted transposase/invertase (TIGR01784 family)
MVQYRKQWKGKLDDPLSRWLAWFNMSKGKELAEEAVKMDAAIQAANDRMVYVTGDKEAIRAYEMRQMALSDYTSEMNYARDVGMKRGMRRGMKKGIKEGIKEGRADEKLEIARKMKEMGDSIEKIHTITGLSTETIEQI